MTLSIKPNVLVSVVIPVFNQEKYVVDAVESALTQTYENVEVIVVDDGSTDSSSDLVKRYFGSHVNLIVQKNSGPSSAINVGIRNSKGSFIGLLGGDDLCKPDRVSKQLDKLIHDKSDFVFSRPEIIDSQGKKISDEVFSNFYNEYASGEITINHVSFFKNLFFNGNSLCSPSVLFKRSVVNQIGYFNEDLIHLQDYDYWLKALSRNLKFSFTDERLVFYRRHGKNLSSLKHFEYSNKEKVYVLSKILDFGCQHFLRNVFSDFMVPTIRHDQSLSKFEKSLIMINHPDQNLRNFGYIYFLNNTNDSSFINAMQNGFDKFKFLYNLGTNRNI
jgi:glycosyltransferase involved in cell wall biosynthesis